jgi:hypothetical protein
VIHVKRFGSRPFSVLTTTYGLSADWTLVLLVVVAACACVIPACGSSIAADESVIVFPTFAVEHGASWTARVAASGEPLVAATEPLLRAVHARALTSAGASPGLARSVVLTNGWWRSARPIDEHPAQMRVARFGDAALRPSGAARVLGQDQADERHGTGRRSEATRVAQLRGDRERGQIIDPAEAAQALDTRTWGSTLPCGRRTFDMYLAVPDPVSPVLQVTLLIGLKCRHARSPCLLSSRFIRRSTARSIVTRRRFRLSGSPMAA